MMECKEMFSVENKNILVTGASGIIGAAIAIALAGAGANLILLGRSNEKTSICLG